jgi:hypothetical protein
MIAGIIGAKSNLLIEFGKTPLEGVDLSGKYDSVVKYDHKTPQFMRTSISDGRVDTDPIYNILAHELHHTWRRVTTVKGNWYSSNSYGSNDIGKRVPGLSDWETYAVRHTNLIRRQAKLGYIRTHYLTNEGEYRVE